VALGDAERVVSVESDSETLWWTGCQREKMSSGSEFELYGIKSLV